MTFALLLLAGCPLAALDPPAPADVRRPLQAVPFDGPGRLISSADNGSTGLPTRPDDRGTWWLLPEGTIVRAPGEGKIIGIKPGTTRCGAESIPRVGVYLLLDPGNTWQVGLVGVEPQVAEGDFVDAGDAIGTVAGPIVCGSNLAMTVWDVRTKLPVNAITGPAGAPSLFNLAEPERRRLINTQPPP